MRRPGRLLFALLLLCLLGLPTAARADAFVITSGTLSANAVNGIILLTTNFTMTGVLRGGIPSQPGLTFDFNLTGQGTALVELRRLTDGAYRNENITYNFQLPAAVPEPATLLLLGTGLAGVGAAVCRRSAARHNN